MVDLKVIQRVDETPVIETFIEGMETARKIKAHSVAFVLGGEEGWIATASVRGNNNDFQIIGAIEELKLRILRGG